MKFCRVCGTELSDRAVFCHVCGSSEPAHQDSNQDTRARAPKSHNQTVALSKNVFYIAMLLLAIMGLALVGLASRGITNVSTTTSFITQMQLVTVSFTSSATMTMASTVTVASFSTLSAGPPPAWFNQQYCGYPFNPYICNEGPPVTVTGYLTNDTSCVNLDVGSGQNYVVWNLPHTYATGAYQVYGFVYPNWPQTEPFPPYAFQKTICVGIPMWAIPPYIQTT
jgi:hypothetical protein